MVFEKFKNHHILRYDIYEFSKMVLVVCDQPVWLEHCVFWVHDKKGSKSIVGFKVVANQLASSVERSKISSWISDSSEVEFSALQ